MSLFKWANCYILTRKDGAVFGWTEHNSPLFIEGVLCTPAKAITTSTSEQRLGGAIDSVDVNAVLSSQEFKASDVQAGVWDDASLRTLLVDWSTLTVVKEFLTYKMADFEWNGDRLEVRNESAGGIAVNRNTGVKASVTCGFVFGSPDCGVDVTANEITVEVTAVNDTILTLDLPEPTAGQWQGGGAIFDGFEVGIAVAAPGTIYLRSAFPTPPAAGDAITLRPGCGRTEAQCRTFDNFQRYGGKARLAPNSGTVAQIASSESGREYDGGSRFNDGTE